MSVGVDGSIVSAAVANDCIENELALDSDRSAGETELNEEGGRDESVGVVRPSPDPETGPKLEPGNDAGEGGATITIASETNIAGEGAPPRSAAGVPGIAKAGGEGFGWGTASIVVSEAGTGAGTGDSGAGNSLPPWGVKGFGMVRLGDVESRVGPASPRDNASESSISAALLVERSLDGPAAGLGRWVSEPVASNSGGGGSKSCRDADAANAMASAPYGFPNRANVSLDEMSLSWSGVGPALG